MSGITVSHHLCYREDEKKMRLRKMANIDYQTETKERFCFEYRIQLTMGDYK